MCPTNNVNTLVHSVARLCKQVVSCVQWQTLNGSLPFKVGITGDHGPSLMSSILSGARNRYMCNVTAEVRCPSYLETAFTFSPGCRQ